MAAWSLEEKTKLLSLLREHGTQDLEVIQKKLPNKTLPEIQYICNKHKALAMKKRQKKDGKEEALIKKWIPILKRLKIAKKEPIPNVLPRLLKYIALFERREESSQINLSKCYQILSDISEGKPFTTEDETHDYFMNSCMIKLASFIKNGEIRSSTNHLKSLSYLQDLNTKQPNSTGISNLLAIPDKLLKMSKVETSCNTI